jgi:hypothetical protein
MSFSIFNRLSAQSPMKVQQTAPTLLGAPVKVDKPKRSKGKATNPAPSAPVQLPQAQSMEQMIAAAVAAAVANMAAATPAPSAPIATPSPAPSSGAKGIAYDGLVQLTASPKGHALLHNVWPWSGGRNSVVMPVDFLVKLICAILSDGGESIGAAMLEAGLIDKTGAPVRR